MSPTNNLSVSAGATSVPPAWPQAGAGPAGAGSGLSSLLVSALCLAGLAVLAAAALRRWPLFNRLVAQRIRLRVLESRGLSGRCQVHLVECDGQRFLLGSSPGGVSLLSELPEEEPVVPAAKGDGP